MNRRLFLALVALVIAGGFQLVRAQQTQHLQTAKDLPQTITVGPGYKGPPPFTYKGTWYGFLTDTKDRRLGSKATPDQIRKSVAGGALYMLGGLEVEPADKAAQYAGQWVSIEAVYTSTMYGHGATSDPSNDGFGNQGSLSSRYHSIKIISIKPDTPPNDGSDAPAVNADTITPDTVGAGYETNPSK